MSDPVLSIENLSLALPAAGDRPFAIENLSLTVSAGETLCVVGESGSGKSLTALAVMGLLPRAVAPTALACGWTLSARRSAKLIMPAATVALVSLSIRMKPPSVRLSA